MNLVWAAFRAAVNHAIDERNKEARRTRALERIASALEEHNGILYDYPQPPPPKGTP
jgi:hypothetical protein